MTTTTARIRFRHLLNNVWDVEIYQADLKYIEESELASAIETLTGSRLRALSFGRNRPVRVFTREKWAAPNGWVCAGDLLNASF